jgi:hypothetical protein
MIRRIGRTRLLLFAGISLFVEQMQYICVPAIAMVMCGVGQTMKNVKNVSYSHMVTYLLDDRHGYVKRLVG